MRILELSGLFCLLISVGESFFAAYTIVDFAEQYRRSTSRYVRKAHTEAFDDVRRNCILTLLTTSASFAAHPVFAISTAADNGMTTTKNKKIGGLALKIRSVGQIMVR